jgi:hypothetical protein
MSIYTDRKNYFKALAETDPSIRHGKFDVIDGENKLRVSFIPQAIDKDSQGANYANGMSFPAAVFSDFSLRFNDRSSVLMERATNSVRILGKLNDQDAEKTLEQKIEQTLSDTLDIAKKWVNRVFNDVNENVCTGIRGIDVSSINILEIPAQLDGTVYGWEITFTDEHVAKDILQYDAAYWQ